MLHLKCDKKVIKTEFFMLQPLTVDSVLIIITIKILKRKNFSDEQFP